ncbi:uncharacterized protein ColSpa_03161 [Colletotrichum spaethianum]|uniref:Uncharacterized protein n=1 Tax=Colletotrichum spaethianum TaxID=700344 RepID=A0AA37NY25_9PEZI|nr:uncharacterized protein ColSpa_03161 [Colletotrichum spaethianum]GKT42980.1 hypothetical protein ColSpa_03161 [Colletotrichum spaethianum]
MCLAGGRVWSHRQAFVGRSGRTHIWELRFSTQKFELRFSSKSGCAETEACERSDRWNGKGLRRLTSEIKFVFSAIEVQSSR